MIRSTLKSIQHLEEPTMPTNQTLKICFSLLLTLLALVILASCGESTNNPNPNPEDKTPPAIVSITPADKSSSVSLSAPVTAVFSEAIRASSLTNESVILKGKDGSLLEKTLMLSSDKKTLTIAYKNLATNPGTVTISLTTTITDEAGNALAATSWSYTTPTWLSLSEALDVDKKNFTFEPSMATDKDGNIVIAWYEQDASSQNRIYVKRWNGTTWEQLGGALNTAADSSADYPSLAIDDQNRPVLAWHESTTTSSIINVKIWTGTTWEQVGGGHGGTTVTVDDGEFPSLAIQPDNIPVVAYAKNGDIFVRLWNGSSWVTWDGAGALDDVPTQFASKPSLLLVESADMPGFITPYVAFEEIENTSKPSSNVYVKYYDSITFAWRDIDEVNDELDTDVTEDARSPSLSFGTGAPIVAWEETNGIDRNIHVAQLDLAAKDWRNLGNDDFVTQDSSEPSLLQANKFSNAPFNPVVVWRGQDGAGQNVYLKTYDAVSGLWKTPTTPIEPINTAGIGSEHPVVAMGKNIELFVAFVEFDSSTMSQNLHVKLLNNPVSATR
jgi:Bacterial Ig-like domain